MAKQITEILVEAIHNTLESEAYKERSKMNKNDFTRNRKLSFKEYMFFMFGASKKSLQSGLNMFFKDIKNANETYTKQAFSKGRNRIRPEAFKELIDVSVKSFYDCGRYETFKGYRIMAIDGTKYNLPNSNELLEKYGMQKSTNQVQALGSCLYDTLNGIVIDAAFTPYYSSERDLAEKHFEQLSEKRTAKDLVLFDRGYPSAKLIDTLDRLDLKYVMRCSTEFLKKVETSGNDCIIEHTFARTGITAKMRLLKVSIGDGNCELLITNVFDGEFNADDFKKLYHMRWEIEEKYKDLKTKLDIENFSGTSDIAVQQDYYATVVLSNLAAAMVVDNKEKIKKYNKKSNNKHQYKQNISQTISELKLNLIVLLMETSSFKRSRMLRKINKRLQKELIPIREGRHYERIKKHKSNRFANNRRPL